MSDAINKLDEALRERAKKALTRDVIQAMEPLLSLLSGSTRVFISSRHAGAVEFTVNEVVSALSVAAHRALLDNYHAAEVKYLLACVEDGTATPDAGPAEPDAPTHQE